MARITLTSLIDTAVSDILIDEDDMASDSAIKAPSQQSVKAYVTAQVAAGGGGDADSRETVLLMKMSDTTRSNTNIEVAVADPELQGTLQTGWYAVEGAMRFEGDSAADIRFAWDGPADTSGALFFLAQTSGASTATGSVAAASYAKGATPTGRGTLSGSDIWMPVGGYVNVTSEGLVSLGWTQNVSSASVTRLRSGSWLRFSPVPFV